MVFSAKQISLVSLVFQQVALVLTIRYSRTRHDGSDTSSSSSSSTYLVSTAVVSAEVAKLILNFGLELSHHVKKEKSLPSSSDGSNNTNTNSNNNTKTSSLYNDIFSKESFKLIVPATLYLIQNSLLFVALTNLSVPVYQITNQGKLLTTAVCSRLMLQKRISAMQYLSLAILALGVALVQLSKQKMDTNKGTNNNDNTTTTSQQEQNQMIGLLAVIVSCFTSGFAGVYFEKILKSSNAVSVHVRNIHLSIWSVLLGCYPIFFTKDYDKIQQYGFFHGYDMVVVLVVTFQAMTGLVVSLVMKYADTILKGFATSVAVVLATVLAIVLFDERVDGLFAIGATLVIVAVQMYSKYPAAVTGATLPETRIDISGPHSSKKRPKGRYIAAGGITCLAIASIWYQMTNGVDALGVSNTLK